MLRKLIPLVAVALIGCSGTSPSKNPDPIAVSGSVKLAGGQSVSDVLLNLQPTGSGGHAIMPVAKGQFRGEVIPGKYTYFFAEAKGASPAAFQAIPDKFKSGSLDRQIEIKAGTTLDLTLE